MNRCLCFVNYNGMQEKRMELCASRAKCTHKYNTYSHPYEPYSEWFK